MLTYQQPLGEQLDLLEITGYSDSRLTEVVQQIGGRACRFTEKDGDLRTSNGQRALWDTIQKTQPKHIWISPDCRWWSAWTRLNAARNPQYQQQLIQGRQHAQTQLQLFAKIFQWQQKLGRGFHMEQPATANMLGEPELAVVVKETYKATVDMCAFGLKTPISHRPIRKATQLLSNSRSLISALVDKVCPGHESHQPIAGKLRELRGRPVSQYAGSYCQGFAEHCARHLLQANLDQVLASQAPAVLTRKRFKTSVGTPSPVVTLRAQKRAADVAQERVQPDATRRRLSATPSVLEPYAVSQTRWSPIFDRATECNSKATPILVPPQHDLISMISSALPEYQILQVFVGCGSRNLHQPLGALPATVAPWRVSICSRLSSGNVLEYQCLGFEDRTTMHHDRQRLRIAPVKTLLTIFAQTRTQEQSASADPPSLEGWGPPPIPLHGPSYRSLSNEDKIRLRKIHANLGHPAPETLARHLRAAKESQMMIDAALDYQCDVCLESTEPRHQRPGKLPEAREFNDMIAVDGFFFKSNSGFRTYVLHALDEASCFQQARRADSRQGSHAIQALNDFWISWAGPPKQVYLDPAGEFRSDQVLGYFQGLNTKTYVTTAAWQRGRLERHGDILKDMLSRLDLESPIIKDVTFDQVLQQAILAKNSLVRHSGFAPEQIVFGKSLRLPGSVASDEDLTAHALAEGADLESEAFRQKLDVRCKARRAFLEADNSQALRRATLRRSNPVRGPFEAGMWVLYWVKKSSPNRLAAGRWHGPAKVVCREGSSIVWLAHGTNIIRAAPENLRPASLREWQHLTDSSLGESSWKNAGGASSFIDVTGASDSSTPTSVAAPTRPTGDNTVLVPMAAVPASSTPAPQGPPEELGQPEQELTPQVSQEVAEVERESPVDTAAPSAPADVTGEMSASPVGNEVPPQDVPIPDSDEGLISEQVYLACHETGLQDDKGDELITFTHVETSEDFVGPPLAEDGLPFVTEPLCPDDHQAFCLEVPVKSKDIKKWLVESAPEQLVTLAAAGKRSRAEVSIKNLTKAEIALFDAAKQKEISCWIQTSAIAPILRRKLNPEQVLKSRWILTWKAPEEGESQPRAKARLVVLGFQDPKLVEVLRDAPTLSREGRALVLQTIASKKFRLGSFDIKTAFLRGKADENNPLAMDPPPEFRRALNLKDSEVCQLLGNAYGRVDAPLLFYKELSKQLLRLGFTKHPLEPCVFMLYSQGHLHGILGMHVDDGVCGGDQVFQKKIEELEKTLPFGSRKHDRFTFTGIHLEQLSNFSIRACQDLYVRNIPSIDVGRPRRQTPESDVTEAERSKLRGLVGSLQYAVTHSRPDLAAKLGEVQGAITKATVATLLLANKVLREAQEFGNVGITYLPIEVDRLTFVSFGDASFASSKCLSSHQGALICATDDRMLANKEAPLSPLTWSSKKIPRVVRSTLSAEAYAMSKAVDMLGWMRFLWGVVHIDGFQWQSPETCCNQLNKAIIITDCKSLFDLVTRLAMPACEEFRTTLEVLLIKQRCSENTVFRWVPTTLQAADCLTKPMDASVLRTILAQGRFKLYDAGQDLEKNVQRKQAIEWLSQSPQASLL